jgi:hypothetical protein
MDVSETLEKATEDEDRIARLCKGIVDELANVWMCVRGLPIRYSQTGEEYVTITNDGIIDSVPDNSPVSMLPALHARRYCGSPEQSAIALAMNIESRFGGAPGILYWRVEPEIEKLSNGGWRSYARLLVSPSSVIWRTIKEYDAYQLEKDHQKHG